MRRYNPNERGDAVVVVLLVVILAMLVGGSWWAWKHRNEGKQASTVAVSGTNSSSQKTSPTTQTQTSPCSTNMVLSEGSSDGTAGTMYKHAVVTNKGTVTCTLTGYPTATLVDSHGTALGSPATPNPLYVVSTVTLAPGAQAHAVLGFPDAAAYSSPSACSATSASLQLLLPGTTQPLTTTWADKSCPEFTVTAFQPGA